MPSEPKIALLALEDGTVFTGNQVAPSRNEALVGASVPLHATRYTAFLKYRASFSSQWSDQAVEAGFRIAF